MLTSGSDIAKYAQNLAVPLLNARKMIKVKISDFADVSELQLRKLESKYTFDFGSTSNSEDSEE